MFYFPVRCPVLNCNEYRARFGKSIPGKYCAKELSEKPLANSILGNILINRGAHSVILRMNVEIHGGVPRNLFHSTVIEHSVIPGCGNEVCCFVILINFLGKSPWMRIFRRFRPGRSGGNPRGIFVPQTFEGLKRKLETEFKIFLFFS